MLRVSKEASRDDVDCGIEPPAVTPTGSQTGGGGTKGDEPWLVRIARMSWRFFTWPFRKLVNALRGRIFGLARTLKDNGNLVEQRREKTHR